MKLLSFAVLALLLTFAAPVPAETARGQLKGGVGYSLPSWFKSSFLHFADDVAEARAQGKHVLVFLHLDECPYCARMLKESFESGDNRDFMERHFDVIGINIRGDAETVWIDGATYTERALTAHLKVFATPTVVFLDLDGKKLLQLDGYRDPRALRAALEYVQGQHYRKQAFAAWLAARDRSAAIYAFRDHPQFVNTADLKGYTKPLAVLFEDRQCAECARFHDKTLNHPDVLAEMKAFRVVRLDADSRQPLVTPDGQATTPAKWAAALGLTYRPAVALFDGGHEVFRIDGRFYHFHFKEALRYVGGGYYRRFDTFTAYNAARREELLQQGIDIDYSE
jgi:thioredoxin-related protein